MGCWGSRLKGSWRFLGCPEGRDEGRTERVWGLAVPSNTKTLGGLNPAPGTGPSHPGAGPAPSGVIPSSREKSQRGPEQKQSREEPAGTAELRRRRDRNSPRQSQKGDASQTQKATTFCHQRAQEELWLWGQRLGQRSGGARAAAAPRPCPRTRPGRARDSKKPELELPR